MLDNKLKYLIIGVVALSLVIIAGVVFFGLTQGYKKPSASKQQSTIPQTPPPDTKQPMPDSKIRIVYPPGSEPTSANSPKPPAPAPKIITATGSSNGIGPTAKSIPKP